MLRKIVIPALWISLFCRPLCLMAAEERIKPLFAVILDHEFPDAGARFEEVKNLIIENYYTAEITEEALYWTVIKGMLPPPVAAEAARSRQDLDT